MNKSKHTFFCRDLNFGILSKDESLHASKVLRLKDGDIITVLNGSGRCVKAKITGSQKKEVSFEILNELKHNKSPLNIHIAIAPTKNIDRFAFFLEKVTEMGVKEITPIISFHSERKKLRHDKLERGMISAIKQSGNLFLPRLNELTKLSDFFNQNFSNFKKYIAHCEDEKDKKKFVDEIVQTGIAIDTKRQLVDQMILHYII